MIATPEMTTVLRMARTGVGACWQTMSLTIQRTSPDVHARRRRQEHGVLRLHVERGVPGIEVAHGPRSVVRRRVLVGGEAEALGLLADLDLPALPEGQEELLGAGEPVLRRRGRAAEGRLPRVVGHREAGEIGAGVRPG